MAAYNNLALDKAANDTAADFVREQDRRDREGSGDGEAAAAGQSSDRHQAHLRRHRLLRDVQPRQCDAGRCQANPIEDDHGERPAQRRQGSYEVDALVLATGFDAMTGAVAKIDIRGRGGADAER